MPKPRILPEPRRPINTLKDLDEHFDNLVGCQYSITEGGETQIEVISVEDVYCYVTLEFVQQYYLNHLMDTVPPKKWGYRFTLSDIPGVYKAIGYILQCEYRFTLSDAAGTYKAAGYVSQC